MIISANDTKKDDFMVILAPHEKTDLSKYSKTSGLSISNLVGIKNE